MAVYAERLLRHVALGVDQHVKTAPVAIWLTISTAPISTRRSPWRGRAGGLGVEHDFTHRSSSGLKRRRARATPPRPGAGRRPGAAGVDDAMGAAAFFGVRRLPGEHRLELRVVMPGRAGPAPLRLGPALTTTTKSTVRSPPVSNSSGTSRMAIRRPASAAPRERPGGGAQRRGGRSPPAVSARPSPTSRREPAAIDVAIDQHAGKRRLDRRLGR